MAGRVAAEFDAVVVGGGIVGVWAALDLGLRGARVLLVERSRLGGGTSSRFHGLLHSGGRYVVRDPVSARECAVEGMVLRRVMPHAVEDTGGFFVALTPGEERFYEEWAEAARRAGVWFEEVSVSEARREEPLLSPGARLAVRVRDGVIYARESLVSVALTAHVDAGAGVLGYAELVALEPPGGDEGYAAAVIRDRLGGSVIRVAARVVVNAAGPWAPRVAALAGYRVPLNPVAGTVVAYPGPRLRLVLNRLRPPSDGDILVPYGSSVLAGTTAFPASGPTAEPRPGDVELLAREASALVPALRGAGPAAVFASVRPLAERGGGREASRSFRVYTHGGWLVSVTGGKYTTARLVAEKAADEASRLLGLRGSSRTASRVLRGGDPYAELGELEPGLARLLEETRGTMEHLRGRVAAYTLLEEALFRRTRESLGLPQGPLGGG